MQFFLYLLPYNLSHIPHPSLAMLQTWRDFQGGRMSWRTTWGRAVTVQLEMN